MKLFSIAYCSTSNNLLTLSDIKGLASKATINNKKLDITGCLVYSNNQFFQILEGHQKYINELFLKITKDNRHSNITIMFYEQIAERRFANWHMGLLATAQTKQIIERHFGDSFLPSQLTPNQALKFALDIRDIFCE